MRRFLLLALWLLTLVPLAPAPVHADAPSRTFPETGKTVSGPFLDYWTHHGGLAQQGYPLSSEFVEVSPTDGKPYMVQYFERAVFEYHAETAPNDVLLSLLGVFFYHQKYPAGAPAQVPNTAPGSVLFPQTGHRLGGRFQQYWTAHGGLAQQGYPLSDEFTEVSAATGQPYTVQYFERAVFEYHPENRPPYDVLLSRLGATELAAHYPTGAPAGGGLSLAARLELFQNVWQIVHDDYIYTDFRGLDWPAIHTAYQPRIAAAPTDAAVYDTLAEMIEKLNDGHSAFINPTEAQEDDAMRQGQLQFSGIGVLSQDLAGKVRIVYVVPGGPADQAGLRAFDVIQAVNGTPLTRGADAPRLIRGPPGTTVTLTIATPGRAPRDVTVTREPVTFALHATARRWPGTNIAYLDLPTFDSFGIAGEAAQALNHLAASGPLDGVIVDLRENGGGLIDELDNMLGLFVDGGNGGYDVTLQGRVPDEIPSGQVLPALRGKPMVVLVSSASESASERFAAVLQDDHRATILGTTTAGNTETVYPHDLPGGARLMLAEATYLRTDGHSSIEGKGVVPDIVLDVPWYESPPDQDPQVLAAVAHIAGK
ncbi:MAG TPA: S41 family peptidase [Chloroflexia bacterium]|nr:S41 family peptidase [Chloroflexia bacterium]